MSDGRMQIAELARRSGLSTATLRYYEEQGLVNPAGRTEAGYRIYGEDALQRVGFIRRAKSLGLSLHEIQQLAREPSDRIVEHVRLRHALVHKLAETQQRISELEILRGELQAQLERLGAMATCGHVGDCGCWLPSREEVNAMTTIDVAKDNGCACCGCTCPSDGDCTCCGCPGPNC